MLYIKWATLVVLNLFLKYFVAWPITPIAILFATKENKLPWWLSYLETHDNDLDGDMGWKTESRPYLKETNRYQRYINRCYWLWRNTLYTFNHKVLAIKTGYPDERMVLKGNPQVGNGPEGKGGLVTRKLYRGDKLIAWQWYYVHRYSFAPHKCIRLNLGYKLWAWEMGKENRIHLSFSPSPWMHYLGK